MSWELQTGDLLILQSVLASQHTEMFLILDCCWTELGIKLAARQACLQSFVFTVFAANYFSCDLQGVLAFSFNLCLLYSPVSFLNDRHYKICCRSQKSLSSLKSALMIVERSSVCLICM